MLKQQIDSWLASFHEYASRPGNEHVMESIEVINKCLESLDYDLTKFCISFNGGKDCTVLLHMVYLLMMEKTTLKGYQRYSEIKLVTLLILLPDTFPELEEFIQRSVDMYNLDLVTVNGPDYKQALTEFKNRTTVSHIFMGTRNTDLVKPISFFEPTDPDWPSFIRVNPVLNWSYHQIWDFLRELQVSYCPLYDKGYTSLGTSKNTKLNPKLKDPTGNGYFPAYMLNDPQAERQGRFKC